MLCSFLNFSPLVRNLKESRIFFPFLRKFVPPGYPIFKARNSCCVVYVHTTRIFSHLLFRGRILNGYCLVEK